MSSLANFITARLYYYGCLLVVASGTQAQNLQWMPVGPGPNTQGQVEKIDDLEVEGAVEAIAADPKDPDILYVGAVNGGLWKTTEAMKSNHPHWRQLDDNERSLSIGALELDSSDKTGKTLIAGIGSFSSLGWEGGPLVGLLRTTNGGATWSVLDGGGDLVGLSITGVQERGSIITVAANDYSRGGGGIVRSVNGGKSFPAISGTPETGLPAGPAFDLSSDPANPSILFTNAGQNGIYRSTNSGAKWTKVSIPPMDALIANADNVRISVGNKKNVYVAIDNKGSLAGLFRSSDEGTHWKTLDVPTTTERDGKFGVNPGFQGLTNLSIVADPNNPNLVYVAGDRQPAFNEGSTERDPIFPNSIGARDYTGRIFRVDSSQPSGKQVAPLTHSHTDNGSAPHADSRRMRFAANGTLLEADDGGVYRRSSPQNDHGDWFSMIGDLQVTEFHSVAWDDNAHLAIGGAQDTGTPEQEHDADAKWKSISTGDGGVVAIDSTSTKGQSIRYSSYYNLNGFLRQTYDASGAWQSATPPKLTVIDGGHALEPQFYTQIELNNIDPRRLIIGGKNSVYESSDQGDTIREIGPGIMVNESGPVAFGDKSSPDLLYVGSGSQIFIRRAPPPAPLAPNRTFPAEVRGIAIDPANPLHATVIDKSKVFETPDAGGTWRETTGNLGGLNTGELWSITYFVNDKGQPGVAIGGAAGVYASFDSQHSSWDKLGLGLPTAMVRRLKFSDSDHLLLAATLGRGAWVLRFKAAQ